eukprot:191133-Amphidinium_carterae.1
MAAYLSGGSDGDLVPYASHECLGCSFGHVDYRSILLVDATSPSHLLHYFAKLGEVDSSSSFAEMYNISYVADIADTDMYADEWMVRGVQALRRDRTLEPLATAEPYST